MSSTVTQQVSMLEERLRQAMLASDRLVLDELIAPDLIFTNHLGQLLRKEDDLSMHRSGLLKFSRLDASGVTVSARERCAVVTVRMLVEGRYDDVAFREDLRYTRTWCQSDDGTWQILAAHGVRVQA